MSKTYEEILKDIEYLSMLSPSELYGIYAKEILEYAKDNGGGDSLWSAGTGSNSIQTTGTGCVASGDNSLAEGKNTVANSDYSHSEGVDSKTVVDNSDLDLFGQASHAEGSYTTAKGTASHAEGSGTLTIGKHSHAEGATTTTGGDDSHAEGNNTVTNNLGEHAEGCYNVSHKNSNTYGDALNTQHSIGIGVASPGIEFENNKNAVEVMQNGDVYMIGVGGYDGKNVSEASTVQSVIGGGSGESGLITVAKNISLEASKESEDINYFSASISKSLFPNDFLSNPEKYNLVVSVYGTLDNEGDDVKVGYTANHFCYFIGSGLTQFQCYDGIDKDGTIYHNTIVGLEGDNFTIMYEGKMEGTTVLPEEGSKVSIYLQKL